MVVGPSEHKGQSGVVVQVVAHSGDFVHRYDVEFQDGSLSRYFGFELELALTYSALHLVKNPPEHHHPPPPPPLQNQRARH